MAVGAAVSSIPLIVRSSIEEQSDNGAGHRQELQPVKAEPTPPHGARSVAGAASQQFDAGEPEGDEDGPASVAHLSGVVHLERTEIDAYAEYLRSLTLDLWDDAEFESAYVREFGLPTDQDIERAAASPAVQRAMDLLANIDDALTVAQSIPRARRCASAGDTLSALRRSWDAAYLGLLQTLDEETTYRGWVLIHGEYEADE